MNIPLRVSASVQLLWATNNKDPQWNKNASIRKDEFTPQYQVLHSPVVVLLAFTYLAGSALFALILGYVVARITGDITPVWWMETIQRTSKWHWFRRKGYKAISVKVNLANGGVFFGTLQAVPKDYEVLIAKEKDFSIINALYVTPTGEQYPSVPDEVVLLNTKDVISIQTTEEPLDIDIELEAKPELQQNEPQPEAPAG